MLHAGLVFKVKQIFGHSSMKGLIHEDKASGKNVNIFLVVA